MSLRAYATRVEVVTEGEPVAAHERSFERKRMIYDWRQYVELIEQKPGEVRNRAPFATRREIKQL